MAKTTTKMTDRLVARLRADGATVERANGKRWRVTKPGCDLVWLPTQDPTGRGGYGYANKLAELRRAGYNV